MALSTAITTLNYATTCPLQIETATVVGTVSTAGNATVIITGKELVGSPLTIPVAVALSDTATLVGGKIRTALLANTAITAVYGVSGTTTAVVLTKLVASDNDATLNISINNGTCAGLTPALTSVNTLAGGTFTKLVDIISYPDLGSTPSKLDTTTLSESTYKTSILGLQEIPDLTFECNYDEAVYATLLTLTGTYFLQVAFGTDGKFDWQGQIRCFATGAGVDEVRKMTVTVSAIVPIQFHITN